MKTANKRSSSPVLPEMKKEHLNYAHTVAKSANTKKLKGGPNPYS